MVCDAPGLIQIVKVLGQKYHHIYHISYLGINGKIFSVSGAKLMLVLISPMACSLHKNLGKFTTRVHLLNLFILWKILQWGKFCISVCITQFSLVSWLNMAFYRRGLLWKATEPLKYQPLSTLMDRKKVQFLVRPIDLLVYNWMVFWGECHDT